ncbi:hypothetical protein D3C77_769800 [compost metagenome]
MRDDAGLLEQLAAVWAKQQPIGDTVKELLGLTDVWGQNLAAQWPQLSDRISANIEEMERKANE